MPLQVDVHNIIRLHMVYDTTLLFVLKWSVPDGVGYSNIVQWPWVPLFKGTNASGMSFVACVLVVCCDPLTSVMTHQLCDP